MITTPIERMKMDAKYQKIADAFMRTDWMLQRYPSTEPAAQYVAIYRDNLLEEMANRFEVVDKMFSRAEFYAACGRPLIARRSADSGHRGA